MPVPNPQESESGPGGTLVNPAEYGDTYILGYWWSDADWRWWPYYLGEAREATGNPDLSRNDAMDWAQANGLNLRMSIPKTGPNQRPNEDEYGDYIYAESGRSPARSRGGGGRGSAAAVYRAPDEAALREQLKTYVVAVTGTLSKGVLDKAVAAYLAADRQDFDAAVSGGAEVDPFTAAKQVVRSSAEYKDVHQQRPESVDELDWVTDRQAKLRQLGLSGSRAESLGVAQARMGANDQALLQAGEMQFSTDTGRLLESQKQKIKQSARAVVGLV